MKLPDEIIQKGIDRYARASTECDANGFSAYSPRECMVLALEDVAGDIVRHAMDHGVTFKSDAATAARSES